MNVVNNLEFDWNKIMEAAAGFLKNRQEVCWRLPLIRQKILLVQWERFYCICIRSLYFAAERETGKTGEKSIICVCQEGESRSCIGSAGFDV